MKFSIVFHAENEERLKRRKPNYAFLQFHYRNARVVSKLSILCAQRGYKLRASLYDLVTRKKIKTNKNMNNVRNKNCGLIACTNYINHRLIFSELKLNWSLLQSRNLFLRSIFTEGKRPILKIKRSINNSLAQCYRSHTDLKS